jgi:hypothetical protein
MFAGRKSVAFFAVAPPIRQHEVVRQIHRVSGPSDKVIYMRCLPNNPAIAVEAPPVLKIEQNRPDHGQIIPLAAEQEFVQVGGFSN